jgi:hypothetical protein
LSTSAATELNRLAISPTGFVFDPRSGATYSVNETGRTILEALRSGACLDDVVQELGDVFDTRAADLRRDVLEYVSLLRDNGLVPATFELV